jgi:large subunit ribosomal protein L15
MRLNEILQAAGKYPNRKRVGRGTGSGHGKTSGRGTKGRGARTGKTTRYGYEGGSNPIIARSPKRGFNNFNFRVEYQVVNVSDLNEKFEPGSTVDAAALSKARLIPDVAKPIKILGGGELSKNLTVVATKFSTSAAEKISKAGGTVQQAS